MKSVFRFLGLGVLAVTFTAFGASESFAQDGCDNVEAKQAIYKRFTDNFDKALTQRKLAVDAAKEYIEKYGACADDKAQVDYLKGYIPPTEKAIRDAAAADEINGLATRFNTSLQAKNWDEVYANGKQVLTKVPDPKTQLDVAILLGSIGLDESIKNNDKYNADTVRYAQEAIQKIESGATSDNYGVAYKGVGITYKNAKFPDGKNNALGWLNYTIGYIKFFRDKNKKDALPYFYKVTQHNSAPQKFPEVYTAIGQYYQDEAVRLENQRTEKLKAANNVDTDETKSIYALQKGYADRAIDAYARAYKLFGNTPAEKTQKDAVYALIKDFYTFRNNGKADGMDAYISSVNAKPMPNPTSEVTPVVEATPAATSTNGTTSAVPTTSAPVVNTSTTAKQPAATGTNGTSAAETKTAKTPAKKPAPKKKGTR